MLVQQLCRGEEVGFVEMFCWEAYTFIRDGFQVQQCLRMNSQQQSTVAWVESKIFLAANIVYIKSAWGYLEAP